jgi:hypothetical protein
MAYDTFRESSRRGKQDHILLVQSNKKVEELALFVLKAIAG